jgi:membrane-bound lytic murein transglycosylase D
MMNTYYDAIKLGRLGESAPDVMASKVFLDSVNRGLAKLEPNLEPRVKDTGNDENYAYTYKMVTQKIKKAHTVRSGDNLGRIADRYNVSVSELKKWNKMRSTTIRPGQKIYVYSTVKKRIPVKLVVDPEESIADLQPSSDTTEQCETEMTSQHVTHSEAKVKQDTAKLKEAVVAKKTETPDTAPRPRFIYHTVQSGDTLWNIAQKYKSNLEQIKKLNNISNSKYLKRGVKIKIPVNGS